MILVVDDFRDSAEAFVKLLQRLGYPARAAFSAAEALAFVRAHPPEQPLLVVLDEMMPHMTGIEALREIRADPRIAATPVMFFTAGFDALKRGEAMTLGALAWLYKGSTPDIGMVLNEITHIYESVGGAKQVDATDAPATGGVKPPPPARPG